MPGFVTGSNVLVDRYPFNEPGKIAPVDNVFLKNHIQLTHDLDDDLVLGVGGYLWVATEEVEARGNVALIRQKRRQYVGEELLSKLAGGSVAITAMPYATGLVVKYLDDAGAEQTLASDKYRLAAMDSVYFKEVPALAEGPGTLWFEYEAGYGNEPSAVPAQWKSLVCMIAMRRLRLSR